MKVLSFDTVIFLVIGIVVILLASTYNISQALAAFSNINLFYIFLAAVVWVLFIFSRFMPWSFVLRRLKMKVPFIKSMSMMIPFFGLAFIPSSVGQLLPLQHLEEFKKESRFLSLGILLSLNSTYLLSIIAMAMITAIFVSNLVLYIVAIFAILYFFVSMLKLSLFYKAIDRYVVKPFKLKKRRFIKNVTKYLKQLEKNKSIFSQKDIITQILLFLPPLLLEASILYFALVALNQSISFLSAVFIFSFSFSIGVLLFFFPGAIGPADASIITLLIISGVPGAIAVSADIILRFFNTFLTILVSYGVFLFSRRYMWSKKTV